MPCLSFSKADTLRQVEGLVCAGFEEVLFMEQSETLWDTSRGDPRSPDSRLRTSYSDKLRGSYSWKFSISLPSKIIVNDKTRKKIGISGTESLPPYFSGARGNTTINYRLTLRIKRRGPLKPVNKYAPVP